MSRSRAAEVAAAARLDAAGIMRGLLRQGWLGLVSPERCRCRQTLRRSLPPLSGSESAAVVKWGSRGQR